MQLWRHFDERASDETDGFWKQEVKVGREKPPTARPVPAALLGVQVRTEVALPHLYEDFKKFWKSRNGGTVQSGLKSCADSARRGMTFRNLHAWRMNVFAPSS